MLASDAGASPPHQTLEQMATHAKSPSAPPRELKRPERQPLNKCVGWRNPQRRRAGVPEDGARRVAGEGAHESLRAADVAPLPPQPPVEHSRALAFVVASDPMFESYADAAELGPTSMKSFGAPLWTACVWRAWIPKLKERKST